jgi:hypothetical protein
MSKQTCCAMVLFYGVLVAAEVAVVGLLVKVSRDR